MTKQTRRRFSPEYKEQSVARLSEPGATHSSVAAELGVTPTQLKTWRLELEAAGSAAATAAQKAEAAELVQLRRDNKRLTEEVEVLRKASAFFAQLGIHFALAIVKFAFVSNAIRVGRNKAVHRCFFCLFSTRYATGWEGEVDTLFRSMGGEDMKTKHAFIAAHASGHAIRFMCRVLGVAHSWFHARRRAAPKRAERAARRDRLGSEIREIFEQSKRCYGAPRNHAELKARGLRISKRSVAKLMRENGIRPPRGRRRAPITTDSRHSHAIAPNLLDRNFEAAAPDAVWLADISYIPTDEGWLYLAAVKDLATMEIVGWSMSERLKSVLCEEALKMAIRSRRLPMGLIHHSDRGVQGEFNRSSQHSGIGGCYDGTQTAVGSVWTEQVAFARSTGLGTA